MSDIIKGITNMVESFVQIIWGTITAVVNTVVGTFEVAINFVVGLIKSVFNVSEDLLRLIVGNLTLLITLFVAYWGYVLYQQRQGNQNPQPLKEIAGKVQAATKKTS